MLEAPDNISYTGWLMAMPMCTMRYTSGKGGGGGYAGPTEALRQKKIRAKQNQIRARQKL